MNQYMIVRIHYLGTLKKRRRKTKKEKRKRKPVDVAVERWRGRQ